MAIAEPMTTTYTFDKIVAALGDKADELLHLTPKVSKDHLYLPGPDFVSQVWADSDRNPQVLRGMQQMHDHGRLGGTGYLSILPVDQGVEHSAGASFPTTPDYFAPTKTLALPTKGNLNPVT